MCSYNISFPGPQVCWAPGSSGCSAAVASSGQGRRLQSLAASSSSAGSWYGYDAQDTLGTQSDMQTDSQRARYVGQRGSNRVLGGLYLQQVRDILPLPPALPSQVLPWPELGSNMWCRQSSCSAGCCISGIKDPLLPLLFSQCKVSQQLPAS